MNRFGRIVAVAVLFLWGTATIHCGLELDGLFGAPTAHATNSDSGRHAPLSDTDPDGCAAIESGHFDSFAAVLVITAPALCEWGTVQPPLFLILGPRHTWKPEYSGSAPLELCPCWSFERRTAPPSRAPDFIV